MSDVVTNALLSAARTRHRFGKIRSRVPVAIVLVVLAIVLIGYVVGPMIATLRRSFSTAELDITGFSAGAWTNFFTTQTQTSAVLGSIWLSLLTVVCAGVLGTAMAILLTRWQFPGRQLCRVLVLLPIASPPLMGVWAFKILYGVGGRIPFALHLWFDVPANGFWLRGLAGVLLVHAMTMYPYFYLTVSAAITNQDVSLEEVSYALGASRWRTWTRVLLPMLTPALVAGALLTFMSSMGSYTAPMLFQYTNVMTEQIVIAKGQGDMRLASVISTVLAVVSLGFLIVIRTYEQRRVYRTQSKGGARTRTLITSWWSRIILAVVSLVASVVLILPIATIGVLSFTANAGWLSTVLPTHWTLDWYRAMVTQPDFWTPVLNSLLMSLIAVGGAILVGAGAAYVIARLNFKGKLAIDIAIMLPWALPGTVVAINLITAFALPSPFAGGRILVGTFAIIPLAYFTRFNPLVFRSASATLAQLDPNLEAAARSLGASWWYSFRRVVLPLLWPGVMAGALLAFVDAIGEFVSSILLYTPQWIPLSVAINNANYNGSTGVGSVYGMIQVVLILAVVLFTQRGNSQSTLKL